ncbi:hypothetical protein BGP_6494 [Beggiatoa sp. PS]|nr:hypothetical protein BGP_6494 [Beggiatoa sp. PS]
MLETGNGIRLLEEVAMIWPIQLFKLQTVGLQ